MFYTIYKTTNNINGKFYIGKHQTKDLNDGYLGSGKLINRAIKKYGVENFSKEYLEIFTTEHEMNLAEKILVVIDPEVSYNLCSGGKGGFSYLNNNNLNNTNNTGQGGRNTWSNKNNRRKLTELAGINLKIRHKAGLIKYDTFTGKTHSDNTKLKMSITRTGKKSPFIGIPRSEKTKEKIRNTLLKRRVNRAI